MSLAENQVRSPVSVSSLALPEWTDLDKWYWLTWLSGLLVLRWVYRRVHAGQNLQAAIRRKKKKKRSVPLSNADDALRMPKQTFSSALMDPSSSGTRTWLQCWAAAELCYTHQQHSAIKRLRREKKKMKALNDLAHISSLMATDNRGTEHWIEFSPSPHSPTAQQCFWQTLEGGWQVTEHHWGQRLLQPELKGQMCPGIKSRHLQTCGGPCEQPHCPGDGAEWQAAAGRIIGLQACGDK